VSRAPDTLTESARLQYLDALGIDAWVPRGEEPPAVPVEAVQPAREAEAVAAPAVSEYASVPASDIATLDWGALESAVNGCRLCGLCESRTQTVFGVGERTADWMIIGEAPGAEEDRRGEPFVGRAGQLLNEMLGAVGLSRESVFIANVLKCRPPNNRDPKKDEAAACRAYLDRQIALVGPKMLLIVGRIAAQQLLERDDPVGRLRGHVHHVGDTPAVVTYHPAYLLRSPEQKAKAWHDLCLARTTLRGQH